MLAKQNVHLSSNTLTIVCIVGFTLFAIAMGSMILERYCNIIDSRSIVPLVGALALGLVLCFLLNDLLIRTHGIFVLLLFTAICALTVALSSFIHWLACALAAGFGFAALLVCWGRVFFALPHKSIVIVTRCSFLIMGVALILPADILTTVIHVKAACFMMCSCICVSIAVQALPDSEELAPKAASKSASLTGESNAFSLLMIGMLLGTSFVFCNVGIPTQTLLITSGIAVVTAAIFLLVVSEETEFKTEEIMKAAMGFVVVLCLAPFAFLPRSGQLILFFILVIALSVYSLILTNAIAETARIEQVSPFWKFGKEGAWTALGTLIGVASAQLILTSGYEHALFATCAFPIVLSSLLQMGINAYDVNSFPYVSNEDPVQPVTINSVIRRIKIDKIVKYFDLSPRQKEVLTLLVSGMNAQRIAETFSISSKTAKSHIYNLYQKTGVHSRQELLDLFEHAEELEEPQRGSQQKLL